MEQPRGGWSSEVAKPTPASGYDIKYGHGLLESESGDWPDYLVVTTPSALRAATPFLSKRPSGSTFVRTLDWNHLDRAEARLTGGAMVVGIGGGMALDASKYIALKRGLPLVLVPTLVSTGAIIHGHVAKWEGHRIIGSPEQWPWRDFEDILVDYDVVLTAPDRLNTAGLGDVLCGFAGIAEWRHNDMLGVGDPFDSDAVAPTADHHRRVVEGFPPTLAPDGSLTPASVRFIMSAIQERDGKSLNHPAAISADHSLWLAIEEVNDKGYIHGGLVALSAVVISWHCGETPDILPAWLDACMVGWRPADLQISRTELRRGLEFAPSFLSDASAGRDIPSILRRDPIVGQRFDELWAFLNV